MKTQLDNIEYAASGMQDYKGISSVHIELTRDNFNLLVKEIYDEYDLEVVQDVKIVPEPNELSDEFGVILHGVKFKFYIKD